MATAYAHLNLRVPTELKERIDRHCEETGVPRRTYVVRLIDADLPRKPKAKPRRDKLAG